MRKVQWTRRQFLAVVAAAAPLTFHQITHADVTVAANYRQKVLAKSPVAYWRLGEFKGQTAMDETSNGHNGNFYGTPIYGEPGAIRDDPNTAIKLDGQHSYVEIADDQRFSQPTSGRGLTVEAWLRPDSLIFDGETNDPHIHWLGKGETNQYEWAFRFYSRESSRPNRISAYIWNPAGGLGAGAYFQDILTAGEWLHVVACFAPGDQSDPKAGVAIYKNGVLRGGPETHPGALYRSYNIVPVHGNAPVRFGTRDQKSFLIGGLDEVAIYPRVLNAAEILDNYQSGCCSRPHKP